MPASVESDTTGTRTTSGQDHAATEAIGRIPQLLSELQEYAAYYLAARMRLLRVRMRGMFLGIILLLGAGVAGMAALVTSVVLLIVGAAQAVGHLLGGRLWAGYLIVSFAILLLMALGLKTMLGGARSRAAELTHRELEQRKAAQRSRFGRSVVEASGAVPAEESTSVSHAKARQG